MSTNDHPTDYRVWVYFDPLTMRVDASTLGLSFLRTRDELAQTNTASQRRQSQKICFRDPFGMVKWPFKWLSDLQIGDQVWSRLESPVKTGQWDWSIGVSSSDIKVQQFLSAGHSTLRWLCVGRCIPNKRKVLTFFYILVSYKIPLNSWNHL